MNKQELLQELALKLESGDLVPADIMQVIGASSRIPPGDDKSASRLSAVLYFIGGGVVFLGMVFLIAQEWNGFSSAMKIFVTLGSGIAAFVVGVLFANQERLGAAGPAFFLIAALLMPGGLFVTFDEFGINIDTTLVQIQIAGILLATYLAAYLLMRRNVLLTFAFVFGSWLFMASMDFMVRGVPWFDH